MPPTDRLLATLRDRSPQRLVDLLASGWSYPDLSTAIAEAGDAIDLTPHCGCGNAPAITLYLSRWRGTYTWISLA